MSCSSEFAWRVQASEWEQHTPSAQTYSGSHNWDCTAKYNGRNFLLTFSELSELSTVRLQPVGTATE